MDYLAIRKKGQITMKDIQNPIPICLLLNFFLVGYQLFYHIFAEFNYTMCRPEQISLPPAGRIICVLVELFTYKYLMANCICWSNNLPQR